MRAERTFYLEGCRQCHSPNLLPREEEGRGNRLRQRCWSCGAVFREARLAARDNRIAAVFAAAALVFFFPAVTLPLMDIEQFGVSNRVGLIDGGISLMQQNDVVLGLVVLFCSVFLPLVKIFGLLLICTPGLRVRRKARARILHFVELSGRFSALDVLLVAVLVAAFKIGDMVTVHIGPGLGAFTMVVLLSLLSSWSFNAEEIWRTRNVSRR